MVKGFLTSGDVQMQSRQFILKFPVLICWIVNQRWERVGLPSSVYTK